MLFKTTYRGFVRGLQLYKRCVTMSIRYPR